MAYLVNVMVESYNLFPDRFDLSLQTTTCRWSGWLIQTLQKLSFLLEEFALPCIDALDTAFVMFIGFLGKELIGLSSKDRSAESATAQSAVGSVPVERHLVPAPLGHELQK